MHAACRLSGSRLPSHPILRHYKSEDRHCSRAAGSLAGLDTETEVWNGHELLGITAGSRARSYRPPVHAPGSEPAGPSVGLCRRAAWTRPTGGISQGRQQRCGACRAKRMSLRQGVGTRRYDLPRPKRGRDGQCLSRRCRQRGLKKRARTCRANRSLSGFRQHVSNGREEKAFSRQRIHSPGRVRLLNDADTRSSRFQRGIQRHSITGLFLQRMAACDVPGAAMVVPSPARRHSLSGREPAPPGRGRLARYSSGAGSCRKRDQHLVYPYKSAVHVKFFYAMGLRHPAEWVG